MANRSNPTGIRFDIEKIEFIKQREKLKSNQQVVDLLMNRYWWEHKVATPTHKEVPPLELKKEFQETYSPPKQVEYEAASLPALMAKYFERKRECDNPNDWNAIVKEIDADPRLNKQARIILKTTNQ